MAARTLSVTTSTRIGGFMTDRPEDRAGATHAVPHLTAGERATLGKEARALAPRPSHGHFEPAEDRPDPVALLERQAITRVPELVPIRYGRMLASPFAFFRGAALVMAADLASTPRSGLKVQICGDAHLSNFGLFASPERRPSCSTSTTSTRRSPDHGSGIVKRLAASVVIAARDREFSARRRLVPRPSRPWARAIVQEMDQPGRALNAGCVVLATSTWLPFSLSSRRQLVRTGIEGRQADG